MPTSTVWTGGDDIEGVRQGLELSKIVQLHTVRMAGQEANVSIVGPAQNVRKGRRGCRFAWQGAEKTRASFGRVDLQRPRGVEGDEVMPQHLNVPGSGVAQ